MENVLNINNFNFEISLLTSLSRNINSIYNSFMYEPQLWAAFETILPSELYIAINKHKKDTIAHKIANDFIMNYYINERVVKYHFVKKYIHKSNEVTLFEMNIDSSRLDLGRVNGKSIAYEIKTEFDNTSRLEKQLEDYYKVFEYVYVITHPTHLDKIKNLIPEYCGIQTYNLKNKECKFRTIRKSIKNEFISKEAQIRNLTSDDLRLILKEIGIKDIPGTRKTREEILLERCDERKINKMFKFAIKNRYTNQWRFICDNFENILPIDIQSFFHSPIDPKIIYFRP